MRDIIVGFSKPNKWKPFAWAIQVAYGTQYDHVYMKFHSPSYNRDVIYQASKSMVNFVGIKVFESENIIIKEFPLQITDENYVKLMQFMIDNAGKPYSVKEIIGFAWMKINSWFGKKIDNLFRAGTDAYVCGVLAGYIIENFAERKLPDNFEDLSPKDIYELLSQDIKST